MTRLAAVIGAATTAHLEALDGEERATGEFYIQKAAQTADEAWQQTVDGHNGPTVTNPTVSEIEQNISSSEEQTRCTAAPRAAFAVVRQNSAEVSEKYTLLQGCLAASDED